MNTNAGHTGGDDENVVYVTKEGLQKLEDELESLKTERRREVAQRLKEAISYGDLSENSEYEEAKNEQAFVEGRILELEDQVKHAKIITEKKKAGKLVELGSHVVITLVKSGKDSETEEYTIVGSTEADPLSNKMSNESPVGAAIIGHKVGDTVDVKVPSGKVRYKIDKVS
ncbi:transcription elongation factor GreA [Candidatus Peregrinibacteria bacterium CG22_combo_CG10-13_8_21_14_all_44_10]|nr:MAG: transcription elongation factor GreA [Candidatus Peregrinibacteria bacterium CG2_30_44_17]PIP66453.1 MAG: transcription elongation factor GreA [Candidatus Peregrinibacteria bacterium CG22_combo_CG10-13_8_21_14_all_44_10]PIS03642.1 MAG: transcription elongation factor GreA [Candidatus Peregrinibacteria bacterium CG10_big_fil_rev_8_21_14_0_10_44_7]PIX80107.1 MAG: transcription elongation factor GreA [Candidatus Peregrinibacteria bacterium CG_4_10_14_3_um_filter_44_21]PJB89186.1 MAG: trans